MEFLEDLRLGSPRAPWDTQKIVKITKSTVFSLILIVFGRLRGPWGPPGLPGTLKKQPKSSKKQSLYLFLKFLFAFGGPLGSPRIKQATGTGGHQDPDRLLPHLRRGAAAPMCFNCFSSFE